MCHFLYKSCFIYLNVKIVSTVNIILQEIQEAEYCEVCSSVRVFVCPQSYLRNYTSNLHQIFVHAMAMARSSSGGVVLRYVLPVLWMTSYLLS